MDVKVKDTRRRHFGNLEDGAIYKDGGQFFIKSMESGGHIAGKVHKGINLNTGKVDLNPGPMVLLVDAELVVYEAGR